MVEFFSLPPSVHPSVLRGGFRDRDVSGTGPRFGPFEPKFCKNARKALERHDPAVAEPASISRAKMPCHEQVSIAFLRNGDAPPLHARTHAIGAVVRPSPYEDAAPFRPEFLLPSETKRPTAGPVAFNRVALVHEHQRCLCGMPP